MMIVPDVMALALQCAPTVSPVTMTAIVRTESAFNRFAIGVVGAHLLRQPASLEEAVATANALDAGHWNYSVGLAQINRSNWSWLGLHVQDAFDACRNLAAGAAVLQRCFQLARLNEREAQQALRKSLSCYTSGNFSTGYQTGYVQRVQANALLDAGLDVGVNTGLNAAAEGAAGTQPSAAPPFGSSTVPRSSAQALTTIPAIAPHVPPIPVVSVEGSGFSKPSYLQRHPIAEPMRAGSGVFEAPHEQGDERDGRDERDKAPDDSAVVF